MVRVSKNPSVFPTARSFHSECGPHQLQAVVRAFGKDAAVEELYFSESHRRRDWSLPGLFPFILARHGIKARMRFWSARSFTKNLAREIEQDRPVLFVANSIQGKGDLHWLSAWGHAAAEDGGRDFLIYDSQMPESTEPHGNARYHESLLARQLPWFGTFVVIILP